MNEKQKTRELLYKAIQEGKAIRPSKCEICKKEFNWFGIVGHHPDYSQSINVIWCCHSCHGLIHRNNLSQIFNKIKIRNKLKNKIKHLSHLPGLLKKNGQNQVNLTTPIKPI